MSKPRVCVLLAAYNGGAYLNDQIDSILGQIDVEVTLILRDDCSTDNTREIVSGYTTRFSSVHLIKSSGVKRYSKGASGNFYNLIAFVHHDFDYYALSDQDDLWATHKLKTGIEVMKHHSVDAYSSGVNAFWEDGRSREIIQCPDKTQADFLFEGGGQGCTYLMANKFFTKVKEFIESNERLLANSHYHDWTIYTIARCTQTQWFFDDSTLVLYRQHGLNDTGARGTISASLARFRKLWSGWYAQQVEVQLQVMDRLKAPNPHAREMSLLLRKEKSLIRSLKLASRIHKNGRRRYFDRLILIVFVILRKI